MLDLLPTEQINQSNLVRAVQKLNDVAIHDHKTVQTLQAELAERDKMLLKEMRDTRKATNERLDKVEGRLANLEDAQQETNQRLGNLETAQQETNQRLESMDTRLSNLETSQNETNERLGNLETSQNETNERLGNLENSQGEMVELLRMIAENTRRQEA